ncbi:cellulase family glycosylhydrolase, partial [Cryptosporangium minutisporangium]
MSNTRNETRTINRRKLLSTAAVAVPAVAGAAWLGTALDDHPRPVSGSAEEVGVSQALVVPATNPAPPVVGAQFHGTWEMYWNGLTPNSMFHKHLDTLAAQGIQMIRCDVGWSSAQPTNAAPSTSQWYHQRLSIVIDAVRARGMQIFLTVHQSPAWSRPNTGSDVKQYPTDPNAIK